MMLVSHWMDAQGFAVHEMLAGMGSAHQQISAHSSEKVPSSSTKLSS